MPVKLNRMGKMIKDRIDKLSDSEKRDRNAVFNAMGGAMEEYIALLLAQITISIGPTPNLGTTTSLGSPTAPGQAPITLLLPPPGGYFK